MEAVKDKEVESAGEHYLSQCLGKINAPSNARNLNAFANFEKNPNHIKNKRLSTKRILIALCPVFIPSMKGVCIHNATLFTTSSQNTPNFHSNNV